MYYFIICCVFYLALMVLKSRYAFIFLKQNNYSNDKYLEWINKNFNKVFLSWDLILFLFMVVAYFIKNPMINSIVFSVLLFILIVIYIIKYKKMKTNVKINESFNFAAFLLIIIPIIVFSIIFDMDDVNIYHIILILFIYFSYFVVFIGNAIKKIIK